MKAKINNSKWQQLPVPASAQGGPIWSMQIDEVWKYVDKKNQAVCQVRNLSNSKFGEIKHIFIKLIDMVKFKTTGLQAVFFSEEPNYQQKLLVLSNISKWSGFALEVFPTAANLMDQANLYHIWQLKHSEGFPFDINVINSAQDFDKELHILNKDVRYQLVAKKTSYGNVGYLFLKSNDGAELCWKEKQYLKDEIIGTDLTAVEIISEEFKHLDYTCLICLPLDFELDFGIHL